MAPEQIEGGRPGPRSDLYALGCVAFELLTGERPFRRDSQLALLMAHASAPRPRPSEIVAGLGTRYDEFFATALAIDPEERFASGRELGEALRAANAHDPRQQTSATVRLPAAPALYEPMGPAHADRPRGRRRWPLALLAVLALTAGAIGGLVLAGRLGLHKPRNRTIVRQQMPPPARTQVPSSPTAPTAPATATSTYCGGDLIAGPHTTCPFAVNVELAYDRSGGSTTVAALSPATGRTYIMHCSGQTTHVCTGGHDALVRFGSGVTACDQNISVGPNTTCPFAENVFLAYWHSWKAHGAQPESRIQAFSPKRGIDFLLTCALSTATVTCTTAEGALITFPLHAVAVYLPR
jgi:hypothetical protein